MHQRTRIALLLSVAMTAGLAHADEDDTRRLLNQIDRSVIERERSHLVDETPPGVDPTTQIVLDGTTYQVNNTLEDLEPAIYVSMNRRQWVRMEGFLRKYQQLFGHDPAVVLLAEGLLAREGRDYSTATRKLEAALQANPDHARARLELARVYFEDNQSREASRMFEQVSTSGIPDEIRPVIEGFQGALHERDAWHGSLSLGMGYNSNINQANGKTLVSEVCFPEFGCFPTSRTMPDPIRSASMVYDLTLSRRWQLAGHHNALVRGIGYGKFFRQHKEGSETDDAVHFDENTGILYAGYNYLSALDDVSITPLFEHNYGNRHSRYQALGLRAEWKRNITERAQIGINAQRKHINFKARESVYFDDYDENQFGLFGSYMLNASTAVYGGLNYTRQQKPQATASSKEYMANLGLYHMFDAGISVNATALYRSLRHDAEDAFLGGRRQDRQRILILNVGMPRFAFKGITPNLYLKRTLNNSSIDWAYEYQQTEVALKFEKSF
ncbi:tetratricopeptide repeat protein [Kerstersia gyiorum]|uniref:Tetratricopeptide repeat protein n=1 Tax=Kerstersia gyiorum TaxID=206506 RepID=A0A4V2F0D1_9BURK|nr:surface lipoprotein assembly modifier [Kerstersia gyiorum]KAB0544436.1 DUF560 domain-containing protein [Kerstersia gyiorum]RZS69570.1 tetratricopeptide repeat protein [Kerstersia gyiorum]